MVAASAPGESDRAEMLCSWRLWAQSISQARLQGAGISSKEVFSTHAAALFKHPCARPCTKKGICMSRAVRSCVLMFLHLFERKTSSLLQENESQLSCSMSSSVTETGLSKLSLCVSSWGGRNPSCFFAKHLLVHAHSETYQVLMIALL